MGPITHIGLTAVLLAGAKFIGFDVNNEIIFAAMTGGVLLDGDKSIEIVANRIKKNKGAIPDITARCRILHSIFAFPFGLFLSLAVSSCLPFIAVLSHIFCDSFIPGLEKDGKHYPSHSPRKWLANPFSLALWKKVGIGWPITYPPELNWVYDKLSPAIRIILLILSIILIYI